MSAVPSRRLSPEEYLAIERAAEERSEYLDGVMYAMSGASYRHELIVSNLVRELGTRLKGGPCRALASNLRVRAAEKKGLFAYPDVVVVCGEPRFVDDKPDTLTNPTLIVEVLSKSTEDYDRGRKFAEYRRNPTFVEYLVVAQDQVHVEHHTKQTDGDWKLSETDGIDDVLVFPSIGVRLPIGDIYDGVTFPAALDETGSLPGSQ